MGGAVAIEERRREPDLIRHQQRLGARRAFAAQLVEGFAETRPVATDEIAIGVAGMAIEDALLPRRLLKGEDDARGGGAKQRGNLATPIARIADAARILLVDIEHLIVERSEER